MNELDALRQEAETLKNAIRVSLRITKIIHLISASVYVLFNF